MIYSVEIQLTYDADDHSGATQMATELTAILTSAGYGHTATTVLDDNGAIVAEFGIEEEGT